MRFERSKHESSPSPEVSVVIPCLDEAVVADNGSLAGSPAIAAADL